jgi:hypothetical protein
MIEIFLLSDNEQKYFFQGIVVGGMMVLGGGILTRNL